MPKITVYIASTKGIDKLSLEKAESLIPGWRKDYVLKKKQTPSRINGVFAYLLLKILVETEFAEFGAFDALPFKYGENGKPYFSNSSLFFSMSHSKTAVGAAVSDIEIGFDVTDDRIIRPELANRICSAAELSSLRDSKNNENDLRQIWCKKESMAKRSGEGFSKNLPQIDTSKGKFAVYEADEYCAAVNWEEAEITPRFKIISWKELLE